MVKSWAPLWTSQTALCIHVASLSVGVGTCFPFLSGYIAQVGHELTIALFQPYEYLEL